MRECQEMVCNCGFCQLSGVGKGQRTLEKPVCVILFVAELQDSYRGSTKVVVFQLEARAEAILCAYTLLLYVLYFL